MQTTLARDKAPKHRQSLIYYLDIIDFHRWPEWLAFARPNLRIKSLHSGIVAMSVSPLQAPPARLNSRFQARPRQALRSSPSSWAPTPDWPTLKLAAGVLDEMEIPIKAMVVSAHRTPQRLFNFASNAASQGFKLIICRRLWCCPPAGYGRQPGTTLPVIGVPVVPNSSTGRQLLSIVQMPRGIAGNRAIGEAGAYNNRRKPWPSQILALGDSGALQNGFARWRAAQTESVGEDVE